MTARRMPDVLTLAISYLIARADIKALFGAAPSTRVGSELDKTVDAGLPALVVTHIGTSTPIRRHLDAVNIQIDAWASTALGAWTAAETARAALHDDDPATGLVRAHTLGVVTAVEDSLGLQPLEDQDTATPRYIFGVRIYAHPVPA